MKKIFQLILLVVIIGIGYWLYSIIREPIDFQDQYTSRKDKVVDRLMDIRDLQIAYKAEKGKYTPKFDSLIAFYNTGKMKTIKQIGSMDDSLTKVRTDAYEKEFKEQQRRIKARQAIKGERLKSPEEMTPEEVAAKGIAVRINIMENVKDALKIRRRFGMKDSTILLSQKSGFDITKIGVVPDVVVDGTLTEPKFEMDTTTYITPVSEIQIPLFEARTPNIVFLKGLSVQEIANLNDQQKQLDKYQGLKVGDITQPNNNVGNWE